MILKIGNRSTVNPRNLAHASSLYAEARDESGEGARTFPDGTIMEGGRKVARISYNGKVWPVKEWEAGDLPLYDPYGDPARPEVLA